MLPVAQPTQRRMAKRYGKCMEESSRGLIYVSIAEISTKRG